MKDQRKKASAEKRALWAVRQRYGMDASTRRQASPGSHRPTTAVSPRSSAPLVPPVRPKKRKLSWLKRILLLLIVAGVIGGGVFGYRVIAASDKISVADRSIIGQLKDLLLSQGNQLNGEETGRINVLLIAIGGEGHKGQNLADTVMLASIKPQDNAAALLSIPRDLYVQVPEQEYFSKINAVHAYGESQKINHGPEVLREIVEEITGQPVHYYVRVDFTAFKNIIDAMGGVNITIDNSFFDYWHKISFPAGTEKMNGERALAYVRARYIEGSEGGDFKRAARQQQVLLALRDKVFSVQTALDFSKINAILNSLSDNIRTDMELWELKRFYELARATNPDQVKSAVLTTGPKGVLVSETQVLGGVPASVLKPRTGNYAEIQSIVQNIFETDDSIAHLPSTSATDEATPAPTTPPEAEESPVKEENDQAIPKPTVEIRNTTSITGLAGRIRDQLRADDYTVTGVGNAQIRDLAQTEIYLIKSDAKAGADKLATILDAVVKEGLPEQEAAASADVLILVGENANAN